MKLLLEKGGDPNKPNDVRLYRFCFCKELNITNGAHVHHFSEQKRETPVYVAASKNIGPQLMELLLSAGGDPNKPNIVSFLLLS